MKSNNTFVHKQVDKLVDAYNGDLFAICNDAASKSRELMKSVNNSVLESEAITWALLGKKPKNLKKRVRQHMNISVPRTSYMNKLLGFIEDEDILDCVKESFTQSVRLGNLTFYYPVKIPDYKKSRVRVLTRMCWFNRRED